MKRSKKGPTITGGSRPEVQVGPRGGKFYIADTGTKVYGTPPILTARRSANPGHRYRDGKSEKRDIPGSPKPQPPQPKLKSKKESHANEKPQFKPFEYQPEIKGLNLDNSDARITSNQRKLTENAIKQAVKEGKFDALLKEHPLGHFRVVANHGANQAGVAGWYLGGVRIPPPPRELRNVEVFLFPTLYSFEKPYVYGQSFSVTKNKSNDPTTEDVQRFYNEKVGSVVIHELSHHMHHALVKKNPQLTKQVDAIYSNRFEHQKTASRYAMTNEKEWFAETHTAYVFHNEELKRNDPEAWELMRAARRTLGMEN